MERQVVFVCPHGAGKSRIAAAWFAGTAPAGWSATSAGLAPQQEVSVHAPRLLAGSPVEHLLDQSPPRPLEEVGEADLVVAIDCPPGTIPGALEWQLDHQAFDDDMAAELRDRVESLAQAVAR